MSFLTFKELIIKNILRQPRTYLAYYLGSLFSVVVFFTAALMYFHPLLTEPPYDGNTRWTYMTVYLPANTLYGGSLIVIGILALLFLLTMFSQFLNERKAYFRVYLILGMTTKKLWQMVFWENILIGFTSLTSGLVIGLVFSKYILMLSQEVLALDFSLSFYFPVKGFILTACIYSCIFLFISFISLAIINKPTEKLSLNNQNVLLHEPKLNKYLIFTELIMMVISLACLFYLAQSIKVDQSSGSLFPLTKGVLFVLILLIMFVVGRRFLFFDQTLIYLLLYLKKSSQLVNGYSFLMLNNLVYRFKKNRMLLFFISITTLGALITISTTLILAQVELFGTDRINNLAYTYRAYSVKNQVDRQYHQNNIAEIVKIIEADDFEIYHSQVNDNITLEVKGQQSLPGFAKNKLDFTRAELDLSHKLKQLTLLPLSEYNRLAEFNHNESLTLNYPNELVILDENLGHNKGYYRGVATTQKDGATIERSVVYRFIPCTYNAGNLFSNVTVVSDEFFSQVKENQAQADLENRLIDGEKEEIYLPLEVIHFHDWDLGTLVDREIREFLLASQDEAWEKEKLNNREYDAAADDSTYFEYSSAYQTKLVEKQETGTTILISLLICSVFLIFSMAISYLKLFGELNSEARYHRSLDILGITKKQRQQIISLEMLATFFLPTIMALISFLVVAFFVQLLVSARIFIVAVEMTVAFLLAQALCYLFIRHLYLKKIEQVLTDKDYH